MQGKSDFDTQDTIQAMIDIFSAGMHKIRIGKVVSFNPSTQFAEIELVNLPFRETFDAEGRAVTIELPPTIIASAKLLSIYGAFGRITFPVSMGDFCMVHFTDRDMDNWILTGKTAKSRTKKRHTLNDAFFSLISPQPNTAFISNYDNGAIDISSSLGGSIKYSDKLEIKNANKNLKSILETLADALKDTKVLNPLSGIFELPIDAATISAIDNFKSDISSLLK